MCNRNFIGSLILADRKLEQKIRRTKILLATITLTITGGIIIWLIN